MALREGDIVGNYLVQEQLGQGGMATVYKGYHEALDRYVAIKVMHQNFLDDETFIARFQREAQIVARLTHPHIVPVFDFGEHDKLPYLVMKYVEGETLKQRLNRDGMQLDEILRVMKAVGSALTYAHKQDVLHRDIKPSNIVLDTQEIPYITDFGLARLASSGESTMSADMLLGTPHYISPEQAQGAVSLDGRADVYSLGVVLYELLVGHVPFTADTPYAIIHDHIYRPLPPPTDINPEIPSAVEMVLYRALEKNPDNRYTTADEMVTDLEDAIEEANLTSLSPDRVKVAATSIARNRADYANTNFTPTPTMTRGTQKSVRLSDLKRKNKAWHENERFWQTSGCASFLVIAFIAFGIILNMASNITELTVLNADSNISVDINRDNAGQLPNQFEDLGVYYDAEDARIVVPEDITNQAAGTLLDVADDDPITYLVAAAAAWDDDADRARASILDGFAYTDNENRAIYFNSAAHLAEEYSDDDAVIFFSIFALEASVLDGAEVGNVIRNRKGEFLYENIGDATAFTLREMTTIVRNINVDSELDFDATENAAARFALARQMQVGGNNSLAQATLSRGINDNNPLRVEFALIIAEINIAEDDFITAERTLTGILEQEALPPWLRGRADELLRDLRN